MVDSVNLTKCEKISGKVDNPKHWQQIQKWYFVFFRKTSSEWRFFKNSALEEIDKLRIKRGGYKER